MQPDERSQDWQQPTPVAPSVAPYENVADDSPVPSEEAPQVAPSAVENPQVDAEVSQPEGLDDSSEPVDDERASEAADAIVQWQATEYISHDRSALWFVVLAIITLALVAVALFLMQSVTFAILVPVMAAALVIYVRRPPGLIDYSVSRKGIHINDRLYTYDEFRSFGVLSHNGIHSVILVPRKRFQLSQTMYFPEEVGEDIVDMLAARLPMQEVKLDAVDRVLARLHL